MAIQLTNRWNKLRYHEAQNRFYHNNSRFEIIPAGRRSGKTEIAKRKLVKRACRFHSHSDGRFIAACPTHAQAKEIFLDDILSLVPKKMIAREHSLTPIPTVFLCNGVRIQVMGLDQPRRAEGSPIDGIALDEYADMKSATWPKHIHPALCTIGRPGWAILTGVPEGRNHFYELWDEVTQNGIGELYENEWMSFTWTSEEVNPIAAAQAKRITDINTYRQEWLAQFISFGGSAYYAFNSEVNVTPRGKSLNYRPDLPLDLCFDFNRSPGVCAITQEQPAPEWLVESNDVQVKDTITAGIDEVFIKKDSNTPMVCDKVLDRYGDHVGEVRLFGDATGGAEGSAKVAGSDWALIKAKLKPVFGHRIRDHVKKENPKVRARVNAVNCRFVTASGEVGAVLDREKCKMLIRDCEGVEVTDAGEIIKENGSPLSHISDGFGYKIARLYPCGGGPTISRHAA